MAKRSSLFLITMLSAYPMPVEPVVPVAAVELVEVVPVAVAASAAVGTAPN